jgi:regulator of RNase E activity RraA
VTTELSRTELDALAALDTPTVCNAIEVLAPHRTGVGFTTRPLLCLNPRLKPVVGFARTATIRAMHPSGRSELEERESNLAYLRHIAQTPLPTICVIEDIDPVPGFGAWWGEVYSHVHKGLGAVGAITNGSVRDLDLCAEGFQILAGSVGPSHAYTHCVEASVPVTVAGMRVHPGELIHADRHGAVVVPADLCRVLPEVAARLAREEAVWIAASKRADFSCEIVEELLGEAARK